MITMVAAIAENNALGKDNDLLWHLPDDFKRFKQITSGHYIIMGRKTFESFPKPLPNRTHVIITRQKNYHPEGCIIVDSMEKAIEACPKDETIFIIGGGEIYTLGMDFADTIELTRVHENFEADTFFPEIDNTKWKLTSEEHHPADERHKFNFTYQTFLKSI
ncbi:dihydrofolate reductase [Flavobacterium macacae]|uniref:Dihydrofolate reductase n=1 Tax=Flavobacterium macacae TaxID=2488993 RepID=A0A3P3WGC8_9FLAO|nr:dihydrofolate reductase [Flavobacterium macacae]RRJ93734.1 dihydrofolate reductase [Flavobacterium macacae]